MSPKEKNTYITLLSIALLAIAVFATWWFNPSHIPTNFSNGFHFIDILVFTLVSYVVWHPIVMNIFKWAVASHIKPLKTTRPAKNLKVAFITTFVPSSESIELLHKILPAMVNASYEHDNWLLDEGNSKEAKAICKQYGVKYFTRFDKPHYNTDGGKFAKKTKGGNHNSWHDTHGHEYDFVAQIDTDFVPKKNYLVKTLGHFKDPAVAFVGTPQIYGNLKSPISRGAAQQTYAFYGPLMRGLNGMDNTLLIGANHVLRVKALSDVDHYSAHITEDLLTGMKLHSKKWKSVYVPEELAVGEGPSTWRSYFNQQMRWSYGCIDILFNRSKSLYRAMTLRQKIYYLLLQQHYFSGIAMALGVAGLAAYFLLGIIPASMDLASMLGIYIPVIILSGFVQLWLQRFYINPKKERGYHIAGKVLSLTVWPIYLIAALSAIIGKKLTYHVTPKGIELNHEDSLMESLRIFIPHLTIGLICLTLLLSTFVTGRTSAIMVFWAAVTSVFLLLIPVGIQFFTASKNFERRIEYKLSKLLPVSEQEIRLPTPPSDEEKYSYFGPRRRWAFYWLLVSALGIAYGYTMVMIKSPATWWLLVLLAIMLPPVFVNFWLRIRKHRIDKESHIATVSAWRNNNKKYKTVDIFLPSCGEDIEVLRNTFKHVSRLEWPAQIKVYVLDDADQKEVKSLARKYKFEYIVRPNRGELKKAGNMIHAFDHSSGDFILVFDADFVPREDFLFETLPYMDDPTVGIVQTAQHFDVSKDIHWIERYAGVLQEVFFRWIQPARDTYEAAICAGTNVIYRREAVVAAGGFARAPIGEDVHSGVKVWTANYKTRYVQLALAKGLAPGTFNALANQQYRWCRSSMLLMVNEHFIAAPFNVQQRMSFWAAFLYYMSSATLVFTGVLPIIIMLYFFPNYIYPHNYIPMIPAVLATFCVFPVLTRGWGMTIYRQCMINSFCHLLAITHALRGQVAAWVPTGAASKKTGVPQTIRRMMVTWIITTQALLWVGIGLALPHSGFANLWPTIILGVIQAYMLAPLLVVGYDVDQALNKSTGSLLQNILQKTHAINRRFRLKVSGIPYYEYTK